MAPFRVSGVLTPYRAAGLHLLLIGIPLRFGLLPTGWGRGWLIPDDLLPEPCSIVAGHSQQPCSPVEDFVLKDFGVRYVLYYELAWVVWFVMRDATYGLVVSLHRILALCSTASLLFWLGIHVQSQVNASSLSKEEQQRHEFDDDFIRNLLFFHVLAVALSLWTLYAYPKGPKNGHFKWSIPANAIFCGGVINVFVAVAAFQALLEESGGVEAYYLPTVTVTPIVRMAFALAAFYTAVHSVLLLRMRTFLTVRQLRTICLYKVLVNLLVPLFWFPEKNESIMAVDHRITYTIRIVLIVTYLFGFLWAGKAEGFSQILTSEKEE